MGSSLRINVSFCQPKVNKIDCGSFFIFANHKIICFDITMDEAFTVYGLKPINDLNSNMKNSTKSEFAVMDF